MTKAKREILGFRDFIAASLADIIEELNKLEEASREDADKLEDLKKSIEQNRDSYGDPESILGSIDYWVDLMKDLGAEYQRVISGLKQRVERRYIKSLLKIAERGRVEEDGVRKFIQRHIAPFDLAHEARLPLDMISSIAANYFFDTQSVRGLCSRLGDLVGDTGPVAQTNQKMAKPPKIKTLEIGQGLMWGDVHMRFINRSEVEIRVGRKVFGVMNFNGLGFYDERNPKKPDRIWNILVVLAKLGGEIHSKETSSIDRAGLKKGISQLRQRLKDLFGLKEDPFFPFYRNHSYKAKFNISLSGEDD